MTKKCHLLRATLGTRVFSFSILRKKNPENVKITLLVVCKEREIKITVSDENFLYYN